MKTNFIMSMLSGKPLSIFYKKNFRNFVTFNMLKIYFSVHHSKTAGNKNIFLKTTGYKRVLHVDFMPSSARNKPVWKVLPLVSQSLSFWPFKTPNQILDEKMCTWWLGGMEHLFN